MAPTLFSTVFSASTDAFRDCNPGFSLRHSTDGKLFNLHRLQSFTNVKETVIRDFLFADDWNRLGDTAESLQSGDTSNTSVWLRVMDGVLKACKQTKPISYDPSSQYNEHQVASEDTRYGSPFKSKDYINSYHVYGTSG